MGEQRRRLLPPGCGPRLSREGISPQDDRLQVTSVTRGRVADEVSRLAGVSGRRWSWPRAGVIGLVGFVAVALVGVCVVVARVPRDRLATVGPAGLHVSQGATGNWRVGSVEIVLEPDGLTVSRDGRILFRSVPGTAFITAGRGRVGWEEYRGYFWPRVGYQDRLDIQYVDQVVAGHDVLVMRGRITGTGRQASYEVTVRPGTVGASLGIRVPGVTSVTLVSGRTENAAVHGFGEQFAGFNLSGRLLPIVVREQGVGRGQQPLTLLADLTRHGAGGNDQMTYAAWPSFVTDDLRGVRLDPADPSSYAFAIADTRNKERVALELWSPQMTVEVTSADSPAGLVAAQQAGTTRPGLPAWVSDGAIVGLQGGTAEVRRKLTMLLNAGARISGVWIQDWTGTRQTSFGDRLWWTWQLDRRRYPGWARLLADLRGRRIHTTTYVNPLLVDAEPKQDPEIKNLQREAARLGYLVTGPDGAPYELDQGGFFAYLVDLTNPRARAWYAQVIAENVLADGVDGFMADFGENLPYDAELAQGTAATMHNKWPLLWAETVRDACRRAHRANCVTWFRAGTLGQDSVAPLFWNGDQLVDFGSRDGLASALLGTFSAGVSGWPLAYSDVGGYTSVDTPVRNYRRSPELLERWAELQAFGVVMRTHEGNRPSLNSQVYDSARSAAMFARMTQLYAALAPYRRQVISEAVRTGVPAIRHGWLVVPGTAAATVDTQFFLGDHLLVAPVLEPGAASVKTTFPPGRWVDLLSGNSYDGDRTIMVPAPLGHPAAFLRADDPWLPRLREAVRTLE